MGLKLLEEHNSDLGYLTESFYKLVDEDCCPTHFNYER